MSRCRKCVPLPEEVRRAADLLERRWLLSIVYAAHSGALRFNEFRQVLGPIPPRTLAARLVELEDAGVLERTVVHSRPPRVEYHLTDQGRRLKAIVDALHRWAVERPAPVGP
ncbi:MAG: hypothetical protein A2Y55_00695 [Actinobacteria bacterium RBG_16_68_12]|nr:MAG: hypothetical protein A2Y55_00695 [Actinobacteria bacterium RBG_16_68_12]